MVGEMRIPSHVLGLLLAMNPYDPNEMVPIRRGEIILSIPSVVKIWNIIFRLIKDGFSTL